MIFFLKKKLSRLYKLEGLSGSPALIEIGGPPYLLPLVDRTKLYDLREISKKVLSSSSEIFSIGAGAGYHPFLSQNCEVNVMICCKA